VSERQNQSVVNAFLYVYHSCTNYIDKSDTAKIITNERKISSLLKYFSQRVQFIFYKDNKQTSEKYQACLNIFPASAVYLL
ncbi:MAG: hypothetical protein J6U94_04320, partial [Paludibacteraceae bacterium]|nr:hypothetical protein [Paludibacteraceae bacterium]